MWAIEKGRNSRHLYGSIERGKLVTLCGLRAVAPLNYTRVEVEKCNKCEELAKIKKEKEDL